MLSKNEFSEMYDKYFPKLYKYIFFRVQNEELAEDIVSETFLKALNNLWKYIDIKYSFSIGWIMIWNKKSHQFYQYGVDFDEKSSILTTYYVYFQSFIKKVRLVTKYKR